MSEDTSSGGRRAGQDPTPGEALEPLRMAFYITRLSAIRRVKQLRSSGEVREYESYRVTVPRAVVQALGLGPYQRVIVGIAKAREYHLVSADVYSRLSLALHLRPEQIAEMCFLGLLPESICRGYRTFTVIASEDELVKLGLKPYQIVSLEELRARLLLGLRR